MVRLQDPTSYELSTKNAVYQWQSQLGKSLPPEKTNRGNQADQIAAQRAWNLRFASPRGCSGYVSPSHNHQHHIHTGGVALMGAETFLLIARTPHYLTDARDMNKDYMMTAPSPGLSGQFSGFPWVFLKFSMEFGFFSTMEAWVSFQSWLGCPMLRDILFLISTSLSMSLEHLELSTPLPCSILTNSCDLSPFLTQQLNFHDVSTSAYLIIRFLPR